MTALDDFSLDVLARYFHLDQGTLEPLLRSLVKVELRGGDWLFHQGEPGDALYFLLRGRLQVWRETDFGATELLGEVVPGESVGEVGLLTDALRSAGVRASRDSILVRVDRGTLESLADRQPRLALRLAAGVAERLQRNTARERRVRPDLNTIAVVPLDGDPDLIAYTDRLVDALTASRQALALRPGTLAALGAPAEPDRDAGDLQAELKHWIGTLEDRHRRIVFRVEPRLDAWSRYAVRQADLVVRVARADGDPGLRSFEAEVFAGGAAANRRVLLRWHGPGQSRIHDTRAWLTSRPDAWPLHVRADVARDHQRAVRILTGTATGLVLGGGAARGFAHLGIYRAMEELGVSVDWVGGTSMGAIMAASIAYDWGPAGAIERAREAFVRGRPFGDYTLPVVSLLRGRRMRRLSERFFPDPIEDLPIPFFCVSSDLGTGDVNIHERGAVWRATCASAALPGVMPPAVHERRLAVDGAMLNNLPVDIMQEKLVADVVAVDLTARRQHTVDFDEVPSPWHVLRGRLLPFTRRYRLPGAATMMLKATELGTRRRVMELAARADLLLEPPVHGFSMLQVGHFDALVQAGYSYAFDHVSAWLDRAGVRPR